MDIWASRTPRKQAQLNINVGVLRIGNDPESQHSCGFQGFIRDDYVKGVGGYRAAHEVGKQA
jgi:hypothetical protein